MLSKITLGWKLILSFFLVACITLVVGLCGWRGTVTLDKYLKEMNNLHSTSIEQLLVMKEAFQHVVVAQRTLITPWLANEQRQMLNEQVKKGRSTYEGAAKSYEALLQSKDREEQGLWQKFTRALAAWVEENDKIFRLSEVIVDVASAGVLGSEIQDHCQLMTNLAMGASLERQVETLKWLEAIINKNKNAQSLLQEKASTLARRVTFFNLLGMALGFGLAMAIGLYLSRTLSRPVNRVVTALTGSAEQVSMASAHVSQASQHLAIGAQEQASSLEQTAAALEMMAAMTRENSGHSREADLLMKESGELVNKANTSMEGMTRAMQDLTAAGGQTAHIIKTIDEIAFQTNLLALNAAVEAARAGQAGAGFAVVADEVRHLAQKATASAQTTAELVEGIMAKVVEGGSLVQQTAKDFHQMADSTAKAQQLVGKIATASHEQAQGIEQITRAMAGMDQVVQNNAAHAEQSAAASATLNHQAEMMHGVVHELAALVSGGANGKVNGNGNGHGSGLPAGERRAAFVSAPAITKSSPGNGRGPGQDGLDDYYPSVPGTIH